jgi:hypothetical protein
MTRIAMHTAIHVGENARRVWLLVAATTAAALVLSCARAPATLTAFGTYELTWPPPKCPPGECDESDVRATLVLLDEKAPEPWTPDERLDVCFGRGFTLTGCYISRRGGAQRIYWRHGDRDRPLEVGLSCGADSWDRLFIFTGENPRATWRGEGLAGPEQASLQLKRIGAADPQRCHGPAQEDPNSVDGTLRQRARLPPPPLRRPED